MSALNREEVMSFEPPALLINRFCTDNGVSVEDARARFQETLKFLMLCATNRDHDYSPSAVVDTMWHQFILYTKDYFKFCELLGGYIHHQPSESHKPDRYLKTLEALRREFGSVNASYWEMKAADCESCSFCSNHS